MIKNIMFDMDGTLIDCNAHDFIPVYVKAIKDRFGGELGSLIAKTAIGGSEVMVRNDGSRTNREAFMEFAKPIIPMPMDEFERVMTDFYANEYRAVSSVISPKPIMVKAVKELKKRGVKLIVTTNPVFPLPALLYRLQSGGHDPKNFDFVTSYETSSYAKPNPKYYAEVLERLTLVPEETLIVGNDYAEDVCAGKAVGMKTYYLTDSPIPGGDMNVRPDFSGTAEEFTDFIAKNF